MAYSTQETGYQSGSPVELYEFRYGAAFYRYTSADADQTADSKTYLAAPITRAALELTQEVAKSAPRITIDASLEVVGLFKDGMPADFVTLTIRRFHRGDAELITVWAGRVLSVSWSGSLATLHCESVFTSVKRTGLRRLYQKQCPHVLYSAACGLSSASFRATKQVTGVSGPVITLSNITEAASYFVGGYLEFENQAGYIERRSISAQSATSVTLTYQISGLAAGASVNLYPGCDHTLTTCNAKFSNALNYGGFPYIPTKNPFGGTTVY